MKRILSLIIIISILLTAVSINVFAAGTSAEDMYREGMEFFEKEDYDRAFARFQIAGEVRVYAPAKTMLGICYRNGLGTERSVQEAERYFRLSADQGYAPAQANLALMNDQHIDFSLISKGDYFTFGAYEQDNNLANGPEPIEWIVLAKEEKKILIISRYGIDACPYN